VTTAALARSFPLRALGVTAALLAAAGALWLLSPGCLFAAAFHVPCPGCGSTRAARALAHLDLLGALHANPIAPFSMALLVFLAARVVYLVYRDGGTRHLGEAPWGQALVRALLVVVSLQIVVWVLRFFGLFGGPVPV
jgi:hypothetical protein